MCRASVITPSPIEILDASPNAYMLLDRELRYVWANPAYLRVTHRALDELIGRSIVEVFPHDAADPENDIPRFYQLGISVTYFARSVFAPPANLIVSFASGPVPSCASRTPSPNFG